MYASTYNDLEWLCANDRPAKLLKGLEYLSISLAQPPHLVTAHGMCMYGFTDMEHKQGSVLFTSLLVIESGIAMAEAIRRANSLGIPCGIVLPSPASSPSASSPSSSLTPLASPQPVANTTRSSNSKVVEVSAKVGVRGTGQPFATLAGLVNDSISAGFLDDSRFRSGLMLATSVVGGNAQPDVWGSGLAVDIGAGTYRQRAAIVSALASNSSKMFQWGQVRHLPWPMCWESAGVSATYMNPNQCTETGESGVSGAGTEWCGKGNACGSYQNGGYWATPLSWMLPAVAKGNFSLASALLKDVIDDFRANGINEAVNHNFVYNPAQKIGPSTYKGVMGYLASAASVYGAIWTVPPPSPPPPPPSPPPPSTCPCNPPGDPCIAPAKASSWKPGDHRCNLTGTWRWNGQDYLHPIREDGHGNLTMCSALASDCWWESVGARSSGGVGPTDPFPLTFKRCKPYPNLTMKFSVSSDCLKIVKTSDDGEVADGDEYVRVL